MRTPIRAASRAAWLTPFAAAFALSACDAADRPLDSTLRDSAGITIVESFAPVWSADGGWTVEPEPAVEIGVQDGAPEYQLFRVHDAIRLPDGRIAVANTGSAEVRIYSGEGTYERTIGRRGQGPGELQYPMELVVSGDTLLVQDGREIELFLLDGNHVGTRRLDPTRFLATLGPEHFSEGGFPLPDGSYLFPVYTRGIGHYPLGEPMRSELLYMRWHPASGAVDTLARHGGSEQARFEHGGRPSFAIALFGKASAWHVDWSGDRVLLGNGERPEVEVHDLATGARRLVRWPDDRPSVSRADIAAGREERLEWVLSLPPDQAAERRRTLDALPDPVEFPTHQALLSDARGNLWVQAYPLPTAPADTWRVFDPEGRLLGTVDLPRGLRILEIGDDHLLALHRDALDIERIRVYPIRKR